MPTYGFDDMKNKSATISSTDFAVEVSRQFIVDCNSTKVSSLKTASKYVSGAINEIRTTATNASTEAAKATTDIGTIKNDINSLKSSVSSVRTSVNTINNTTIPELEKAIDAKVTYRDELGSGHLNASIKLNSKWKNYDTFIFCIRPPAAESLKITPWIWSLADNHSSSMLSYYFDNNYYMCASLRIDNGYLKNDQDWFKCMWDKNFREAKEVAVYVYGVR